MALNSSGPISLGGSTSGQSIALELGLSATGQISLNTPAVRTLANVSSGAIVMPTDFYGKANTYNLLIYVNGGGGGTPKSADYPCSGGGGGGYAFYNNYSVAPGGAGLTVTVGGIGALSNDHCAARAGTGGTSSVNGGPSMTANGGQGGGGGAGCSPGGNGKTGGTGGTGSGGTTNTTGEQGMTAPTNRPGPGAYGGSSPGPYGGARTTTPGEAQDGVAGNNYGGGAAGPGVSSGGMNNGANGAQGVVVIKYLGSQKGTGGTVTNDGTYTIHTFTNSGTYSP